MSPNEMKFLKHYEMGHLVEFTDPISLWKLMVEKAFLQNESTPYEEAVRRGYRALRAGSYRSTSEFEELIQVED